MAVQFGLQAQALMKTGMTFNAGSFTVMFNFRMKAALLQGLFQLRDANVTGNSIFVETNAANTIISLDSNAQSTALVTATIGRWYCLAFTVNGSTFSGYVSQIDMGPGRMNRFSSTDATSISNYDTLSIGAEVGSAPSNCAFDGLLLYQAVLSADEIEHQFRHRPPQRAANLFGWYPMLDAETCHMDFSGKNNHLIPGSSRPSTIQGSPFSWI